MNEPINVNKKFINSMEQYRTPDTSVGLIEACSKNVVVFAERMLGVRLYAWQVYFLNKAQRAIDKDDAREFVAITSRQIGKFQPYSQKILTPRGWGKMGDLKIGDDVYSEDGNPTKVTKIFEQGEQDNYKITFTDGSYTSCGLDHLWKVRHSGCKHWKTLDLKQIIKDHGTTPTSDNAYRIPMTEPVNFKRVNHKIHPYLLGALLGDGSIKDGSVILTTNDYEMITKISQLHPELTISVGKDGNDFRITSKKIGSKSLLINELRRLGIWGKGSLDKFIPKEYLIDSVDNRIELLRGLMDTDGSIYGNCVMEYSTISKQLKEGVKFLTESLGGNVRVKKRESSYKKNGKKIICNDSYRVYVRLQDINPFWLQRKADRWYNIKYEKTRIIKSIEFDRRENSRCIMVDNPLHTYLTDSFIVTHNSTSLAIFSLWCCIFNKYKGTISNNTSVGIASASDVQAKKLLYEMKKYLRLGDAFMKRTYLEGDTPMFGEAFFSELLDEHEPNNTTTITFKEWKEEVHGILLNGSMSGSTIKSYPATSAVLGETFSVVIIDEAGKSDKITDQFFYDFMYPTGNSTNAIRIYTSTPWTQSGFFYRMVDPDSMYGKIECDVVTFTVEAIKLENPNYYKVVMKTVGQLNIDGKTDEVQRAYYCRFVKGEQSYFNPDRINDVFTKDYNAYSTYKGECDMGVDFGGQVKSRTAITISAIDEDGIVKRLYNREYEVGKDKALLDDIAALKKDFNVQRIIVDDCPAGQYLIEIMETDRGWNVQRMNFRSEKVAKYGAFRATMNRGEIKSYEDDELKTEMLAMEFSNGAKASVIQHAPNYSDDMIDSFVMSSYFFVKEGEELRFYDWDDE